MIKHIALFKLKEFAEGADKAENLRRIAANVKALRENNPQARLVELGLPKEYPDPVTKFPYYDVSVCAEFANEQDYVSYFASASHIKARDFAAKVSESAAGITYEV